MLKTIIVTLILGLVCASSAIAGSWSEGSYNGVYGMRKYKVYIPDRLPKKPAVVVMLHGCEQNAVDFATGTRIEKWADKKSFIALFPEQSIIYNPYKCWNWVVPTNNSRMGESEVIIEMLDQVLTKFKADKERVFAAGMSAGGSMTNILANCYPERFKAIASHDGSQFYSSYVGYDFTDVVLSGASVPSTIAASVGNACSLYVSNRPKKMPAIIFHGMSSPLMSPMHAFQVESELKVFNDYLDNGIRDNSYFLEKTVEDIAETKTYGYTLYKTINTDHEVLIERYMINGLEHGWSGGVIDLPYNDPKGPDASMLIFNFFGKYGL